jgi:hypothetical protein
MFEWLNTFLDMLLQLGISSNSMGLIAAVILAFALFGGIILLLGLRDKARAQSWMITLVIIAMCVLVLTDALVAREREHATAAAIAAGTALPDGTPIVAAPPCENGIARMQTRAGMVAFRC